MLRNLIYNEHLKNNYYYENAFIEPPYGIRDVWRGTPYSTPGDLTQLAYYQALMAYAETTMTRLSDRRELLYFYLAPEYSVEDEENSLRQNRYRLPVESDISYIINNVCNLYDYPIKRRFSDNNKINNILEDIYYKYDYNNVIKMAYQYAYLTNLIAATVTIINGVISPVLITPDRFRVDVAEDDPARVAKFFYSDYESDNGIVFHEWTNNKYIKYNKQDVKRLGTVEQGINIIEEHDNPYGRIPFAFLKLRDTMNYTDGGRLDLIEKQLFINKLKFLEDQDVTYNTQPVKLAINLDDQITSLAPNKIHNILGVVRGEAEYIEPDIRIIDQVANYDEIEAFRGDKRNEMLRAENIPTSMIEGNTHEITGIARVIERIPLTEARNRHKERMMRFEREYAELTRMVLNVNKARDIPELAEFTVDYYDEQILMQPQEDYKFDLNKLKLGLIDVAEFYRKWAGFDQSINKDDIIDIVRRRREEADELGLIDAIAEQDVEQSRSIAELQQQRNNIVTNI